MKLKNTYLYIILSVIISACGSSNTTPTTPTTPTNTSPTATAATDQSAVSAGNASNVNLSVAAADADNDALTFQWRQTAGSTVTINADTTANANFDIPGATADETLTFTVTVTDANSASVESEVSVFVTGNLNVSSCPASTGNLTPVALASSNANAVDCQISGVLTADATLDNGYRWFLEGALMVGNTTDQAILTIAAGTSIYGDNVDVSDFVFVYPGSSIQSNGTGSNPVVFSSDDTGHDGPAEWGGLFIRGDGDTQGDNLLDYTVVAEGGYPTFVAGTTYTDNIVINGADDGTRLTFVQSHDSNRDGIRLQNTSARLSWILVTGATRDGIWYSDFNGLVKDLMVIHRPTSGRAGIYGAASTTTASVSNPRFVNATLVGRDGASVSAAADSSAREFGILFADNKRAGRYANILIANFRNGCYEVEPSADISALGYIDGIHCANEAGPNGDFAVVRAGGVNTANVGNGNGDGVRYYNGSSNPITFTGETAARDFTAGWYLNTLGTLTNGLAGTNGATSTVSAGILNAFRNGDTNGDGNVNADDIGANPFLGAAGPDLTNPNGTNTGFNHDVAGDTGGYDLTHIGSVRSGADASAAQFNNWTVQTGAGEGFAVPVSTP